jgi:hypothetical protein
LDVILTAVDEHMIAAHGIPDLYSVCLPTTCDAGMPTQDHRAQLQDLMIEIDYGLVVQACQFTRQ